MDAIQTVREHYDQAPEMEWDRIAGRPEFLLTCRFLDRYIQPGDRVLDIGGGPGRYSLYLAQRGAQVTLFDLSPQNVAFARQKAAELGLSLDAYCGDARSVDTIVPGTFDHVLLMGPLYHLLEEADRIQAIRAALSLLREGGTFWASFILLTAGIIFGMRNLPELILEENEQAYHNLCVEGEAFSGPAFTQAYFLPQAELLPFMAQFPLEKLHLFAQEGILSPNEEFIRSKGEEVYGCWLDLAERLCEKEELLSWGEHLMYVGKRLAD